MLITQSDIMDVPASLSTIVTLRENNSWGRSLYFENKYSASLSIQIETSGDGGATWALIGTAFALAAAAKIVKEVTAAYPNILRVRASGGGEDRDLYIGYARMFATTNTWTDPTL